MALDPEQKRKPGRPRKTIEASELETLRRLVEADPGISLRAIAEAMATQVGKRLSLMAWPRALKSLGISKVTAKKAITSGETAAASKATHYRAVHRREPEPLSPAKGFSMGAYCRLGFGGWIPNFRNWVQCR